MAIATGYEIYKDINPDIIVCCIVVALYQVFLIFQDIKHNCKIIGSEPEGADSMKQALKITNSYIDKIDNFVDGASVSKLEKNLYNNKKNVDNIYTVSNNKLCRTILEFYQNEGIILEPVGL